MCSSVTFMSLLCFFMERQEKSFTQTYHRISSEFLRLRFLDFQPLKNLPPPPLPQKKYHHSYFQKWWLRFHFCVDNDFIKISDYNISFKIDECHYRNRNMSYSYICQFRRLFWAQSEKPTSVRCEASRREASCKSLTPPRVPPLRWRRPYDIVPTIYILLEVDE